MGMITVRRMALGSGSVGDLGIRGTYSVLYLLVLVSTRRWLYPSAASLQVRQIEGYRPCD